MADRWLVDAEHPDGHLVPLTPDEETQLAADRAAWANEKTVRDAEDATDRTIRERLEQALAQLEAANTNWATLTAAQKDAALRLNVRATAGLVRLAVRRLDAAG